MPDMGVSVIGTAEAQSVLRKLQDAARSLPGVKIQVGSPLKYAYGIETGRTRDGAVARAAGGLWFLKRGLDRASAQFDHDGFGEALKDGPGATLKFLIAYGHDIEREAKDLLSPFPYSPRTRYHTGGLRRSLQTIYPGRPVSILPTTRATVRPRR
jgi:hypothetical protein